MQTEVEATVVFEEKDREKVRTIATLFKELEYDYHKAIEDYEPDVKNFRRLETVFRNFDLALPDFICVICGDEEYNNFY